jgi:nitrous oxidase accessory protein NosD
MKKILTFGIMLMFILMTVSSANEVYLEKQSTKPLSFVNTLYVGGNGTGNYSSIQEAIDDSNNGDTVYVYDDSSPYYENLIVDKSITLKGENKETTVINGSDSENVVNISADNVILSGFTILNHGNHSFTTSILYVQSNYTVISGNIIKAYDDYGINIPYTEYTTISDNTITGKNTSVSWMAIYILEGKNNNISRNIINNFKGGITFAYSNNYSIYGNILTNMWFCINPAGFSINDVISLNNISGSWISIYAVNCFNYKIIKNNFISKTYRNAGFGYFPFELFYFGFKYKSIKDIRSTIEWDGNYWNRPRNVPKLIIGEGPPRGYGRLIHIDKNPAQEPYNIGM